MKDQTTRVHADAIVAPAMFSVPEFCRGHSISRALFYKLHKEGKAPRICKVGARSLISAEDAAAWRHRLEREAA
jgi:predicted DNA-binding transcriptional regulator AlpA